MTATHGMSVEVQTPDGIADAYVAYPYDGAAHPGVLVIQDGFGLRPSLRSLADRIAAHGYTVLLPNAYYRHGRAPVIELPDCIDPAERPEIVAQVFPMICDLTPELLRSDTGAYLEWLVASPQPTTPRPPNGTIANYWPCSTAICASSRGKSIRIGDRSRDPSPHRTTRA